MSDKITIITNIHDIKWPKPIDNGIELWCKICGKNGENIMKWISIEDKYPQAGDRVIIKILYSSESDYSYKPFSVIYFSYYCCREGFILPTDAKNALFHFKVTHWTPIPEFMKD